MMSRQRIGASVGLRSGVLGLVSVVVLLAVSADSADARRRHRYDPPDASIVVDANSGKVLEASNADALRHPASLTKIMTLYLLFERLKSGAIKLDTEMSVSRHAAAQAPTKLGLRPGHTLAVEDAIKGLVTRSANDAAVVIAEAIGGSEPGFARMMTRKAHALGMSRTTFRNASGLPDDDQVTTARDMALLGRAIQQHFPKYYKYFSTKSFSWRGRSIRNHNHLLGRVDGVDGIKTGYTRASGFNLVTSIRRDGRHMVAVVLGGNSSRSRDAHMRTLLARYIKVASTKVTAPPLAKPVLVAEKVPLPPAAPERDEPATVADNAAAEPAPGSTDPIRPLLVKTITVKPRAVQTASLAPTMQLASADSAPAPAPVSRTPAPAATTQVAAVSPRPGVLGTLPAAMVAETATQSAPTPAVTGSTETPPPAKPAKEARKAPPRSGWMIQVGAFTNETEAKERLSTVQERAKSLLSAAEPFTQTHIKGDTTYYRARFAGLAEDQAYSACKYLKRKDFACFAIKN